MFFLSQLLIWCKWRVHIRFQSRDPHIPNSRIHRTLLTFQSIDQPASQPIVVAPISLFPYRICESMVLNYVVFPYIESFVDTLHNHGFLSGHRRARVRACPHVCVVHCTINRGQSKWDGNTKQWCDHVYDWLGTIIYIFMCIYCVNVLMLLTLCLLQCCTLRPMQHFIPQTAYHDMPLLRTRWKFQFI